MSSSDLAATARSLVAPGKGILAADESTGTMTKRLDGIGVASSEATRRAYRGMLFETPGMEQHISGVILYDETIRQQADDGRAFPDLLASRGVLPGIKVDSGAKALAGHPGETVTEGLDGLRERLAEYRGLGARFAKWRAVIAIGPGLPSPACLETNAHALARYAALCQEAGLVPIVEPEVLMDGAHDLDRCETVTTETLGLQFEALRAQGVQLEGMLLKPNMVISGTQAPTRAGVAEVAAATLRCFRRVVPAAVPGIVFLSGGQSDLEATEHLDAMNRMGPHPWQLSFSYGRALQAPALAAWAGKAENRETAQRIFAHRAACNGAARDGRWTRSMEQMG
ncbi:MAG: fructose-bisphosphate aldolase class I [Caldilineae bacterium]|nr:fructose-bisphosphate aldolase class I [Chloroflexota bacterium]MCB9175724.1 fructose-bisphosphate aldolase class I [Caldilineae bacterium]